MAKYDCNRCGAMLNTTMPPHLCKDVDARLRRRQRQVDAVLDIMRSFGSDPDVGMAEAIVKKLSQLGVTED